MSAPADDPVVVLSFARTPIGAFRGALASVAAPQLGAVAIAAAVRRAGIDAATVEQAIMGCVLAAGLGQAPARQAALGAGLPLRTAATTVNKMCGSGMQAAIIAHDMLASGSASMVIAGGMESMSNAPYLLERAAQRRVGHGTLIDSMLLDGLEDVDRKGSLMGVFAEEAAQARGIGRDAMDAYAMRSLQRARDAQESGAFDSQIAPVELSGPRAAGTVNRDEQPDKARPERIASLPPAFAENGRITAASSSSISDGAAALLLSRASVAAKLRVPVAARIAGHTVFADAAPQYPVAPAFAIRQLLRKLDWRIESVELFEVNEAFAIVPMIAMTELALGPERMNVRGGACALGHPIGASGARIIGSLLASMIESDARRGIAAVCLGGGEATAIALER